LLHFLQINAARCTRFVFFFGSTSDITARTLGGLAIQAS
jgi:hypothetical protein